MWRSFSSLPCPSPLKQEPSSKMSSKVYIIGVGLTQFLKPRGKVSYTELGLQAIRKSPHRCKLDIRRHRTSILRIHIWDSTCGQRVLYQLGMTQIPIVNVNNNCSTGSTALWMGRNAIRGGELIVFYVLDGRKWSQVLHHLTKDVADGRAIEG